MEDTKWMMESDRVHACLEGDTNGEISQELLDLVNVMMVTGENSPAMRVSIANSVKTLLKDTTSGQAVWKRGNQGILTPEAGVTLDLACHTIYAAALLFFESTQLYSQSLLRKHGKSKGIPLFADSEEYATALANKAEATGKQLFKNKEWDGTKSGFTDMIESSGVWENAEE